MATRRHRDVNTFGDLSYLSECRFESMMRCQGAKRRAIGRSPLPLVVMDGSLRWWCIVRGRFCVYSMTISTHGYELNRRARARSCAP